MGTQGHRWQPGRHLVPGVDGGVAAVSLALSWATQPVVLSLAPALGCRPRSSASAPAPRPVQLLANHWVTLTQPTRRGGARGRRLLGRRAEPVLDVLAHCPVVYSQVATGGHALCARV
jgi:hypothetical protein